MGKKERVYEIRNRNEVIAEEWEKDLSGYMFEVGEDGG